MHKSDRWLAVVFVISIIVIAIMIVLLSCLSLGTIENDSIMSSALLVFMFGRMLVIM